MCQEQSVACRSVAYRRFVIGRASIAPKTADFANHPRVANLRYSRLQVCATSVGNTVNRYRMREGSGVRVAATQAEVGKPTESSEAAWHFAGVWYLAGANTCVYSNPKEELGATQHIVQTSNRRFRDDEFIIPRELTRGREHIRVRIRFTPAEIPLFPGQPVAELAWSEIRYDAYCWVMPRARVVAK